MADSDRRPIGWGVVSTGNIAHTVTGDLNLLEDSKLAAVSSRSLDRAQAFADEFGVARAYDFVAGLLDDPEVDVVYVATPHAQHPPVVRAAIDAGKAVLCEKALTTSLDDTIEMVHHAKSKGVFCMEAMWTRFTPLVRKTVELVASGAIGEVRSVSADLGFIAPADRSHRLWDPAQGGGALLDVGIYPVAFAHMVLGAPSTVTVAGALNSDGVDAEAGLQLSWDDGARAHLDASLVSPLPGGAVIVGTTGRIEIPPRFHHPERMIHVSAPARGEQESTVYEQKHEGRGYVPMLRAVAAAVREGRTERDEMPLQESVEIMRTLQTALDRLGVEYPAPNPVPV